MAALTGPRITKYLGVQFGGPIPPIYTPPRGIADNVVIYAGAMVAIDTSGYARPARLGTSTDIIVGIAQQTYDNTVVGHVAGGGKLFPNGINIQPVIGGWVNDTGSPILASTQVRTEVYALDDQTVTLAAGTESPAGLLYELGADGYVYVIPRFLVGAVA